MRRAFAQDAVLSIAADGDLGAPGAAITSRFAAVGSTSRPLASHDTWAERVDDEVDLRTLFVVESARDDEV